LRTQDKLRDPELQNILEINNLTVHFGRRQSIIGRRIDIHALDNVSLKLADGEVLSLVGESGSGKSTLARTVLKLVEPTSGTILFRGRDILSQSRSDSREFRRRVQMVFQDPYESLNPQSNVFSTILEPLVIHKLAPKSKEERETRASGLLNMVGLDPSKLDRFPHELSGGERQRVAIARALSLRPELLIADEPVSMLDVSVRLGILNLLLALRKEFSLTYLFITHDLGVAKYVGTRIVVLYFGQVVEIADADELTDRPMHSYTNLLLSSIPGSKLPEPAAAADFDYVSSASGPPSGCRFHTRCPYADERCVSVEPKLVEMRSRHFAACHHPA
jgi:oligopeptide/dipeptide ABC transporter ATP-binding protein